MKSGDLVYVDYISERKYFLIKRSIFSKNAGKTCYKLVNPQTGKTLFLWEHQIGLVHAS